MGFLVFLLLFGLLILLLLLGFLVLLLLFSFLVLLLLLGILDLVLFFNMIHGFFDLQVDAPGDLICSLKGQASCLIKKSLFFTFLLTLLIKPLVLFSLKECLKSGELGLCRRF